MENTQNFRSALGGFNREDVVHYIAYINNKHAAETNQLKTEIQTLRDELAALRARPDQEAELEAANAKCADLAQELEALRAQMEAEKQAAATRQADQELEAYRRAERAERLAGERVSRLYEQASGILADSAMQAEEAASQIDTMAQQAAAQLSALQDAVLASKCVLSNASQAIFAIRPDTSEE